MRSLSFRYRFTGTISVSKRIQAFSLQTLQYESGKISCPAHRAHAAKQNTAICGRVHKTAEFRRTRYGKRHQVRILKSVRETNDLTALDKLIEKYEQCSSESLQFDANNVVNFILFLLFQSCTKSAISFEVGYFHNNIYIYINTCKFMHYSF